VAGEVRLGTLKANESREARSAFTFGLEPSYQGAPLQFKLQMTDGSGGRWIAEIRISLPPAPPLGLTHTGSTSSISLAWRPGSTSGVFGYHIYRASRVSGPYKRVTRKAVRGMTFFRDSTVRPNSRYFYVVTSVTPWGLESVYSRQHQANTLTPLWGRRK